VSAGVTAEREVALPLADLPPGASTNVKVFGTTVAVFNVGAGRLFAVGRCVTAASRAPTVHFDRTRTATAARGEGSPVPGAAGSSTYRAGRPRSIRQYGGRSTR
jgi:hypothetical protein